MSKPPNPPTSIYLDENTERNVIATISGPQAKERHIQLTQVKGSAGFGCNVNLTPEMLANLNDFATIHGLYKLIQ